MVLWKRGGLKRLLHFFIKAKNYNLFSILFSKLSKSKSKTFIISYNSKSLTDLLLDSISEISFL